MPNYGLVITPQYNPMTYEQYIAPFREYAGVYNQMADAYDKLEMEANQWEKLAQNAADKPQYDQYKRYSDDLHAAAEELATNGLSPRTRSSLSGLYKRYAQEINPIAEAYAYRQKMSEEQRKLNPAGDMQFDVDFSNIGLSPIMENPNLGYQGRSLSQMEAEAAEQAKALSTRILSKPAKKLLDEYTFYFTSQGVSAGEAQKWWNDQKLNNTVAATEVESFINDIYNQTKTKYNIYGEDSPYTEEQDAIADNSIVSGILKGLSYQGSYTPLSSTSRGSGSGSGSGDSDYGAAVPLGYEITVGDETYTAVNERGNWEYYNSNGQRVFADYDNKTNKTTISDSNGEKINEVDGRLSIPEARYIAMPLKDGSNRHYIFDNKYGTRVMQNGHAVTLDVDKQTWNAVESRAENIVKEGAGIPENKCLEIKLNQNGTRRANDAFYDIEKGKKLEETGTQFVTHWKDEPEYKIRPYSGDELTQFMKRVKNREKLEDHYSNDQIADMSMIINALDTRPSILNNLIEYEFLLGHEGVGGQNDELLKVQRIGTQKTSANSPYNDSSTSQDSSNDSNFVPKIE